MIYFDNSATSYPKPPSVIRSAANAMKHYSFNSGRGGYSRSVAAAEAIYSVREKVADMFSFSPQNVVFTKNCTEALNIAITGSVKRGDHIIISDLEHNSVLRVVHYLKESGVIDYDLARYSFDDDEIISNFESLIKPNTSLIVCMHSSNAFGVSFPISRLGDLCQSRGIRFIVDAAQGAGVADIDAKRDKIDILCAPGHKCLFGNMGTGFLAFGDDVDIAPYAFGGTGSNSFDFNMPLQSPDRFEAGTLNNSGIISLGEGIDYINSVGRKMILNHELAFANYIYKNLERIDGVELYTPNPMTISTMPIISFNFSDYPSERVASRLADDNICVRAGFHCSPLAHKHFGTQDRGTVRISVGCFNTERDCNSIIKSLKKL